MSDIIAINQTSPFYPPLLQTITDPPAVLYVRGRPDLLTRSPLLAVVGSRKASVYGQQAISRLLTPVVRRGVPLVSGLAYGIDSIAHKLCLDQGTPTIAVLGSGLDNASIYPRLHVKLADAITAGGGVIISEYPTGTPPNQWHFPARNRIIAGVTAATIIIQAAARSGSLITARLALEYGRDVAAVPGHITDSLSTGTNLLIQQGAAPLLNAQDVFDLLGLDPAASPEPAPSATLTSQQRVVLEALSTTPRHVDQLTLDTSLPAPAISVTLTELELLEVVQHVGGMKYVRKS